MSFTDTDARDARGAALAESNLNGFDFVLVSLPDEERPPAAHLEVHFVNSTRLPALLASGAPPKTLFPLRGGHRVRAGEASGEVQVTGTFVQVAGSVPIERSGLAAAETLTIEAAGGSVEVELPEGTTLRQVVAAVDAELGAGMRALALDGRLTITSGPQLRAGGPVRPPRPPGRARRRLRHHAGLACAGRPRDGRPPDRRLLHLHARDRTGRAGVRPGVQRGDVQVPARLLLH